MVYRRVKLPSRTSLVPKHLPCSLKEAIPYCGRGRLNVPKLKRLCAPVARVENAVKGAEFDLNIIPQTMAETVFGHYRVGSRVNLEVDVIARYLERLIQGDAAASPSAGALSMETLAENGFLGAINTGMWKQ